MQLALFLTSRQSSRWANKPYIGNTTQRSPSFYLRPTKPSQSSNPISRNLAFVSASSSFHRSASSGSVANASMQSGHRLRNESARHPGRLGERNEHEVRLTALAHPQDEELGKNVADGLDILSRQAVLRNEIASVRDPLEAETHTHLAESLRARLAAEEQTSSLLSRTVAHAATVLAAVVRPGELRHFSENAKRQGEEGRTSWRSAREECTQSKDRGRREGKRCSGTHHLRDVRRRQYRTRPWEARRTSVLADHAEVLVVELFARLLCVCQLLDHLGVARDSLDRLPSSARLWRRGQRYTTPRKEIGRAHV